MSAGYRGGTAPKGGNTTGVSSGYYRHRIKPPDPEEKRKAAKQARLEVYRATVRAQLGKRSRQKGLNPLWQKPRPDDIVSIVRPPRPEFKRGNPGKPKGAEDRKPRKSPYPKPIPKNGEGTRFKPGNPGRPKGSKRVVKPYRGPRYKTRAQSRYENALIHREIIRGTAARDSIHKRRLDAEDQRLSIIIATGPPKPLLARKVPARRLRPGSGQIMGGNRTGRVEPQIPHQGIGENTREVAATSPRRPAKTPISYSTSPPNAPRSTSEGRHARMDGQRCTCNLTIARYRENPTLCPEWRSELRRLVPDFPR